VSNYFSVSSGVRQVSVLSPKLLVMDLFMSVTLLANRLLNSRHVLGLLTLCR
jgi:hypothetical protein